MTTRLANPRRSLRLAASLIAAALLGAGASVEADTVFLKNGALIDGTIVHRNDDSVLLQIGSIGKLEIPLEDIYLIEKNKRQGGELLKNSLDTKSKVEFLEQEQAKLKKKNARDDLDEDVDDLDLDEDEESEKIDPALERRIKKLVRDLDNVQRRYRVRAERHLKAVGRPAVPYLIPLAKNERDLTRIAVFRLFLEFGDDRVIDACVDRLKDVNEYVRDYANQTLVRVTGEDFGYSPQASPRRRELAARKWKRWWESEQDELEATRDAVGRRDDDEE